MIKRILKPLSIFAKRSYDYSNPTKCGLAKYDEIEVLNDANIKIEARENDNAEYLVKRTELIKIPFWKNIIPLSYSFSKNPEEFLDKVRLKDIVLLSIQDGKRVCIIYSIPKHFIKTRKSKYNTEIKKHWSGVFIKAGKFDLYEDYVDWDLVCWDIKRVIRNWKYIDYYCFRNMFCDLVYKIKLI